MLILNQDYEFVDDPALHPAGHYVSFFVPPPVGYKNIKVISLKFDTLNIFVSHNTGDTVFDAGDTVRFDYSWEPTDIGLQYNETPQSSFLLKHGSGIVRS